jgi:TetR/AcrR family transcriptional regulator, multidrug resistance operon repressor
MRPKDIVKEEAIKNVALQIISEEGLENLSMQKLAKAANISPRTIYIKYKDKEDLLIKLFIEEVTGAYEKAVLAGFDDTMDFADGIQKLWKNTFHFLKNNRPSFALMQYGKSSPLLNNAFQEKNIREGQYFSPIHSFLKRHAKEGTIKNFPVDIQRALLFAPLFELVKEYFDYTERPRQIITEKVIMSCCEVVLKGILV